MNCHLAQKNISFYLDSELSDKESQELLSHLDSCKKCMQEFRSTQEILKSLPVYEIKDELPYFYNKIKKRIMERREKNAVFFPLHLKPAVFAAISFSFIVLGSFLTGAFLGDTYWTQANNSEPTTVTEAKSTLKLGEFESLPDNSVGDLYNKMLDEEV